MDNDNVPEIITSILFDDEICENKKSYICVLSLKNRRRIWNKRIRICKNYRIIEDINDDNFKDIICKQNGYIIAISGKTGEFLWEFEGNHLINLSKYGYPYLFLVISADAIYIISAKTGKILWEKNVSFNALDIIDDNKNNHSIGVVFVTTQNFKTFLYFYELNLSGKRNIK
jgi:outer membrane protein assembly factor BamB